MFVANFVAVCAAAETWIWYPGQLSAHMQQVQRVKSAERCVNVGYPGKFEQASGLAYFRDKAGFVEKISCDGLPAKWVVNPDDWQVSLDSLHWNIPEFDSRLVARDIRPDAEREIIRTISVDGGVATPGNPYIADFGELEVGCVRLRARGAGKAEFVVGECREEALCRDTAVFEQRPLPEVELSGEWQEIVRRFNWQVQK